MSLTSFASVSGVALTSLLLDGLFVGVVLGVAMGGKVATRDPSRWTRRQFRQSLP